MSMLWKKYSCTKPFSFIIVVLCSEILVDLFKNIVYEGIVLVFTCVTGIFIARQYQATRRTNFLQRMQVCMTHNMYTSTFIGTYSGTCTPFLPASIGVASIFRHPLSCMVIHCCLASCHVWGFRSAQQLSSAATLFTTWSSAQLQHCCVSHQFFFCRAWRRKQMWNPFRNAIVFYLATFFQVTWLIIF